MDAAAIGYHRSSSVTVSYRLKFFFGFILVVRMLLREKFKSKSIELMRAHQLIIQHDENCAHMHAQNTAQCEVF